jgi:hypothetical protein
MTGSTGRCTPSPYTPAPPLAAGARDSGLSDQARARRGVGGGARTAKIPFLRWWPTAFTATTRASPRRWPPPACGLCWPSGPQGHLGAAEAAHTPTAAAGGPGWRSPNRPGRWRRIQRCFRDRYAETWWRVTRRLAVGVLTGRAGWWWPLPIPAGCAWLQHLILADRAARPRQPARAAGAPCQGRAAVWAAHPVAQGYKQVKGELGWADLRVRSDRAIRRALDPGLLRVLVLLAGVVCRIPRPTRTVWPAGRSIGRTGPSRPGIHAEPAARSSWPAVGASGAGLAAPMEHAAALLTVVVASAPATEAAPAA